MPRGGRRPGAGRPGSDTPVVAITLSEAARQELAELTEFGRRLAGNSQLSQRAVVLHLIHNAWVGLTETQKGTKEMDEESEREENLQAAITVLRRLIEECENTSFASWRPPLWEDITAIETVLAALERHMPPE